MQLQTKKQYKEGTKIELDNKIYVVVSSIDMEWLTSGENKHFVTVLKRVE